MQAPIIIQRVSSKLALGGVSALVVGWGTIMQGGLQGAGMYPCAWGGARTMLGIVPGASSAKPKKKSRRAIPSWFGL